MSRALFLIGTLICAAPAYAETTFLRLAEDVPLPAGFAETQTASEFISANGRIIIAAAEGDAALLAVRDFYYDTLPQLGWSVSPRDDGVLMFQRGREQLTFTVERVGSRTRLGVRLAILAAPMNAN